MASVWRWGMIFYAITLASSDVLPTPDGIYRKAAHYFIVRSNRLIDVFSSRKMTVYPSKLKIKRTKQLGDVISLDKKDYYVNIKGFQGKCITDPTACSNGLSVAFWLYMVNGKHVIAGRRFRGEPRSSGFVILHDSNSSQFRIEVATSRNKWTALLHKIPFTNQWFHLTFTWSELKGIRIFVNGQFVLQGTDAKEKIYSLESVHEANSILIGGKDPFNGRIENINFKIAHLAIWNHTLVPWQIQLAYKLSIKKDTSSSKCCHELSVNKCVTNVCYKFREPERCKKFFDQKKCLCADRGDREQCSIIDTFKGECKDKRKDCKALTSQEGYCKYYQQEMRMLCPLSCKICYVSVSRLMDDKKEKIDWTLEITESLNETKSTTDELEAHYFTRLPKHPTGTPNQENESTISTVVFKEKSELSIKKGNSSSLRFQRNRDENHTKENDTKSKSAIQPGQAEGRKSSKMSKEVLVFALIGCAAGIILLFLISLYSWKVYRSKFTGAFIPSFKAISSIEVDEYGDEKWTRKYIDSSYFVIKDVPPKKRALPAIPIKPPQPKYQPPDFQ